MARKGRSDEAALAAALEHHRAGRLDEAGEIYRDILRRKPRDAEALRLYGVLLGQAGRTEEAIDVLRRAVAANPDSALAHENLGQAYKQRGALGKAVEHLRRAIALEDGLPSAHFNLGLALQAQDNAVGAITSLRRALDLRPEFAECHDAIANAYRTAGATGLAREHYEAAITQAPGDPRPRYNLGVLLAGQGAYEEALARYREALSLRPDYAEAMLNSATTLQALGRRAEALVWFDRALVARPDWPEAHWDRALARLQAGDHARGFAEYDWRWRCADFPSKWPGHPYPVWNGALLDGRRLLVWGEQGVGDQVFFAGLVPDLVAAGAACIIACEPRLVPLFARSFPEARVLAECAPDDPALAALEIDLQCPMGSLPRWLRPDPARFPAHDGYLAPDLEVADACRRRYDALGGRLKVGIAWRSGNRDSGAERSVELGAWRDVLALPGARFFSLQYGEVGREIALVRGELGIDVHEDPAVDQIDSLDAFAAQIAALDLVISVDNTTVHMAGALGKPVWTLLPLAADWRWMTERADSPWYPSMRLYRQPARGDWRPVLDAVRRDLAAKLG